MTKPPAATPNSDIDGVHRDERRNSDIAHEQGEGAAGLGDAERRSTGRPRRGQAPAGRDERS